MPFVSEQLRVSMFREWWMRKIQGAPTMDKDTSREFLVWQMLPSTPEIMNRRDRKPTATMRDGDQGFSPE